MGDWHMSRIRELDERFQRLTGREGFGYVSHPTKTTTKFVFADGQVIADRQEAVAYMQALVHLAAHDPGRLPYPFDQPLEPSQDLRVIHGWERPEPEPENISAAFEALREWRENPPAKGFE